MSRSSTCRPARIVIGTIRLLTTVLAVFTLSGPLAPAQAEPITGVMPLSPQPASDAVKPGLAVEYIFEKFYTLDELYKETLPRVKGKPIPNLNQLTETDPVTKEDKIINVLTTDQDMMVGAFIRGMIYFAEAGNYVLYLVTNDGARFWVGGVQIWEDPDIHFDRESDPLELVIGAPGWYELKIDYYQKKGTHALQLLWTPPGGEKTVVPPDALGYLE